jgi:hypothetical protein
MYVQIFGTVIVLSFVLGCITSHYYKKSGRRFWDKLNDGCVWGLMIGFLGLILSWIWKI